MPNSPAKAERGHIASNWVFDRESFVDKDAETAWEDVKAAATKRDVSELRKESLLVTIQAIAVYCKAIPTTTYQQLERAFRHEELPIYLIACEKDIDSGWTLTNPQGDVGLKYTLGFFFGADPPRASLREGWPSSPEENLERLEKAGVLATNRATRAGRKVFAGRDGNFEGAGPDYW
ncbi:hypothetical protein MMC14_010130 [Varicellaria rhodocarpa]|nr:hypothetical protein [Varicellaria rhodocarpa]